MTKFAHNFRFLRENSDLSLTDLAKTLGCDGEWIVKCEQGKSEPNLRELVEISELFHVSADQLIKDDLRFKLSINKSLNIKFLVTDVDGVLTDGGMNFTERGDEFKKFNVKDGMGITFAMKKGIEVGFLSSGHSEKLIPARAEMLGIRYVYVGRKPKEKIMEAWLRELKISFDEVAYVGDDVNDIALLEKVGLAACPADAVDAVKQKVNLILNTPGGQGCIRELVEGYLL